MLRRGGNPERLLTTVLFTDIVGSTERAAQLGDRGWKDVVARHHAIVRQELHAFHGRELDTAGDGFFAIFDRPAQAIECATRIIDDLGPLGVRIRASIHMGEAEVMGGKVGGMTVHVASRALAQAGPSEILVTRTVREVTAGADVSFDDRGVHEFKGVPGAWDLYAVAWKRREPAVVAVAPSVTSSRRRNGLRAIGGAALVGAIVTAVGAYALVGGHAAPPLVALPNSAIAVDQASHAIVAVERVGRTPTGIAADRRGVWIVNGLTNELTKIDPVTRGVVASGTVGMQPVAVAIGSGSVWIAHGIDRSIWSIDSTTLVRTDAISLQDQPSAIAIGLDRVWVASTIGNSIVVIDAATKGRVKTIELDQAPRGIAVGSDAVWVAGSRGALIRVDPSTLAVTDSIPLPGPAEGVVAAGRNVWVTVQQ